jgi:hypothetical protein
MPLGNVSQHRSGWESLYRHAFPDVYRAVLAVVRDPDIALDAVQDAFEIGLRKPPATDANLTGWLFRVAVRRALRVRPPGPSAGSTGRAEGGRAMLRISNGDSRLTASLRTTIDENISPDVDL